MIFFNRYLIIIYLTLLISIFIYTIHKTNYNYSTNIHETEHFYDDKLLPDQDIYCILITGKSKCRTYMAYCSIANFLEQSYARKKLIIINHGKIPLIKRDTTLQHEIDLDIKDFPVVNNIYEFMIDKHNGITLGDLRNIALELVPPDALWTTWDDDDYRHKNYLKILKNVMDDNNADTVVFTRRYEFNNVSSFVWEMNLKSGFVFVLSRKDKRIKYKSKDTMEDTDIINLCRKYGKIHIFDNKPSLYIRMVHGNNTSLYVNNDKSRIIPPQRKGLNYIEKDVSEYVQNDISIFMSRYYKKGLICMRNLEK